MSKLVFWVIIFIAILVLGRRLSGHFFNDAQTQHSLPVLIAAKQTREFMGLPPQQQTEPPPPRVNYYVTFRPLAGADEKEFQVSRLLYEQLLPEQTGVLVFQGSRFIAFEPDSAHQHHTPKTTQ
ncbi:DUF2500 domain-containing protein [Oceanisphaera sp. W20_SRM_FM3]|uniref:DUF2500 domain-containing protein n=1 Tax=Oceanisphaera sp. W20_SRM_FM3 TaxID=3240267 RepID=UPI003F9EA8BD